MFSFGRIGFVVLSSVFAVACAGSEGASGSQGSSALMTVSPEPAGTNCANGGQAMVYGVDANSDGKLTESEVDGTSFVCNGSEGEQGTAGMAGTAAAKGEQGAPGAKGIQGEQGDKGLQGLQGLQGVKGDTGATGATGAAGADGQDGTDGTNGTNGTNGVDGKDGANGKDAPQVVFGQFLASQVIGGMLVQCATTSMASPTTAECRGMKVNGLDVYLGPAEANAICAGVTGKGYNTANGLGVVPAPWLSMKAGQWNIASSGNASPMQNLTCNR